jgi:hypothetical protein
METRFDLDPTFPKVVIIALLLCIESLAGNTLLILQNNRMPTMVEFLTILVIAVMVITTYLLTFLRTGQTGETT